MTPTDGPDEQRLADLLERTAARVPVGPAPLLALQAGAARARRRRAGAAVLGSAAAVAAVVAGTTLLPDRASTTDPALTPAPTSGAADPDVAPPGTRLVGVGRVAVAVPLDWTVGDTRCGTPQSDTVVVDQAVVETCATTRPDGVESIQVEPWRGERNLPLGTPLCRFPLTGGPVCTQSSVFPEQSVAVTVTAPDRERVEQLLDSVRVLEDSVGVPPLSYVQLRRQDRSGEAYVRLLQEAGLRVEQVVESTDGWPRGFVVSADPAPGTVVPLGSTVRVTVSSGPGVR